MEQVEKAELLRQIAEASGCAPATAEQVWSGFSRVLPALLQESESIDLGEEIGKLVVRERPEGHGGGGTHRSLKKRRRMAFFKASNALERQLVQSDEEFLDMLIRQGQAAHAEEVRRGILARSQTKA